MNSFQFVKLTTPWTKVCFDNSPLDRNLLGHLLQRCQIFSEAQIHILGYLIIKRNKTMINNN